MIFQPNIREQRLLIRDQDSWKNVKGDDLDNILSAIKQVVFNACHGKINGELCPTDEAYDNMHPVVQQAIYAYNGAIHEIVPNSSIMNSITSWRQIPKATLVNAGIVRK